MTYVAPSTVAPGQTYSATAHNVIVEDIIDHEARIVVAAAAIVPTGSLTQYIGPVAPAGWLLCEGQEVSRATYSALWDVLRAGGATSPYGNGNGSTTFNVPDLRGRVPVGKGTNNDVNDLGDSDGISTVANRRPQHNHNFSLTAASAGQTDKDGIVNNTNFAAGGGTGAVVVWTSQANGLSGYNTPITTANAHTHSVTGTVGETASGTPTNVVPYLTLNYIIKT